MPKKACYPTLPANPNIAIQVSDTPLVATLSPEAPSINFYEYWMPKDGDCGYHTLGIPRSIAAKQLFDNANNAEIRRLVAPEIEAALLENDFPASMKQEDALQVLFQERLRFIAAEKVLDESVAIIKATFGSSENNFFAGLTAEQLSVKIEGEARQLLREQLSNVERLKKSIYEYCQQISVYKSYIRNCIAQPGYFLTFLGSINGVYQSSSLDAIAKLNRLSVQVWGSSGSGLQLLHHFHLHHSNRLINMHYIPGHFNLLNTNSNLAIYPVSTHAWTQFQSKIYSEGLLKKSDFITRPAIDIIGAAMPKAFDKSLSSLRSKGLYFIVNKLYQHYPCFLNSIINTLPDSLEGSTSFYLKVIPNFTHNVSDSIAIPQLMALRTNRDQAHLKAVNQKGIVYLTKCEIDIAIFEQIVNRLFPSIFVLANQYFKKYPSETVANFSKKLQRKMQAIVNCSHSEAPQLSTTIIETKHQQVFVAGKKYHHIGLRVWEKDVTGHAQLIYEHYQLYNPEIPSKTKLSGFESFVLQLDHIGNLDVLEIDGAGNFIFNLEDDLTLLGKGFIEGNLTVYTPHAVFNKGHYHIKESTYIECSKLINRGSLNGKTITINQDSFHQTIFDNHYGMILAEFGLIIHGNYFNNRKGVLSATHLKMNLTDSLDNREGQISLKNGGAIQAIENINNKQGVLETDLQEISLISISGKVECFDSGYIRAWRGTVKIEASTIALDESSLIHGKDETILIGKKLKLGSLVSGAKVTLNSQECIEIASGALGYQTLTLSCEKQRLTFKYPIMALHQVSIIAEEITILDQIIATDITLRVKNKLIYSGNSFISTGTLAIYSEETLNFDKPFILAGSLNLFFSPNAKTPLNILYNIVTGSSKNKLNGSFSIYAPTITMNVGNEGADYVKIAAKGDIKFHVGSFILTHGKIVGEKGLSIVSETIAKIGRLASIAMPCGLLSAGQTHLEAGQTIQIEAADIYGDQALVFKAPASITTISSNIHTLGNALIDTPLFTHSVITNTVSGGNRVGCTHPNTHYAYKTIGPKFEVLSRPSILCVGKILKTCGQMDILGSQVQHNGFEGLAPTITTLIPYESWTLSTFGGHRKLKHAWWSHSNHTIFGTPASAIFSSGADLILSNTDINIFGFVFAKNIKIHSFQSGTIGLTTHHISLSTPRPFKQIISLLDHIRPSARYELVSNANTIKFRSVLSNSFPFQLPPLTILNANGSLEIQPPGATRLMPSDMEAELLIHSSMAQLKRGLLEAEHINMHTIFYQLVKNAYQFMQSGLGDPGNNFQGDPLWCQMLDKPILVYKIAFFGNLPKLSPYLILPLNMDNPRARDWIGGLYSSNSIDIQGTDRQTATLHITAHIDASGLVKYRNLKTVLHEKYTYHAKQYVENSMTRRRKLGIGRKTIRSTDFIGETIAQAGNTIVAGGVEFDNIGTLIFKGVDIQTGGIGIRGTHLGQITEYPIITHTKKAYHIRNRIEHFSNNEFLSSQMNSNGSILLESEHAHYHSISIFSKQNIRLQAKFQLNFGAAVITQNMPMLSVIKRHRKILQWNQIEKPSRVSIQSETGDINCSSTYASVQCIGTEIAGRNITLVAQKDIIVKPLILKHSRHTFMSGVKALSKYKQSIHEKHEYGIPPFFLAHESIKLTAATGDVLLVAPFIYAGEAICMNTLLGNVIVKPVVFHHDLSDSQRIQSLSFLGSEAVLALIRRDCKQAALALLREFPILGSIEQLMKSKTTADKIGNGLIGLYHFLKTLSQFYFSESLEDFLSSQLAFNIKMRTGSKHIHATWTELALPWLYAKNIIAQAKTLQMESIQVEAETAVLEASTINFTSATKSQSSQEINHGVTLGVNLKTLRPSISVDYAKENNRAFQYIHSHLNIAKMFKVMANDRISLQGVYVKTAQTILEAKYIHLETLRDVYSVSGNRFFASSNMAFSAARQYQNKTWASEQTGIDASECLYVHAHQQLNLIGARLTLAEPESFGTDPQVELFQARVPQRGMVRAPLLFYRDVVDQDKSRHINVGVDAGGLFFDKSEGFKGILDAEHRSHHRKQINRPTIAGSIEVITDSPPLTLHRDLKTARELIENQSKHQRAVVPLGSAKDLEVGLKTLEQSPAMLKQAFARHLKDSL